MSESQVATQQSESINEIVARIENRKSGRAVRHVDYMCVSKNCEGTDTLKLLEGEHAPAAINCYSCGGGRGMSIEQQISARKGMFVVKEPEEAGN